MRVDVPLAVSDVWWRRRPKGRAKGYTEKWLGWCVWQRPANVPVLLKRKINCFDRLNIERHF